MNRSNVLPFARPAAVVKPIHVVVGEKYEATRHLEPVELLKLVRADVKTALPEGFKASVRKSSSTHSLAIDVTITETPEEFPIYSRVRMIADLREPHAHHEVPWMSELASRVVASLEAVLATYNHDASDSASDYYNVRFYAHVSFAGELSQSDRARCVATCTALLDAAQPSENSQESFIDWASGAS